MCRRPGLRGRWSGRCQPEWSGGRGRRLGSTGRLVGVFLVGDELDLDVGDPSRRSSFAEGDAEDLRSGFCDLGKGGPQGFVILPNVRPDAVCRKEEDLRTVWKPEFLPCLRLVSRVEDLQVHAVRDHLRRHNPQLLH